MTNLVPDPAGQEKSCFPQGSEQALKQAVVGSGVFLGRKVGMELPGPLPSWVPNVGRGRGIPPGEQLDKGVMENLSEAQSQDNLHLCLLTIQQH